MYSKSTFNAVRRMVLGLVIVLSNRYAQIWLGRSTVWIEYGRLFLIVWATLEGLYYLMELNDYFVKDLPALRATKKRPSWIWDEIKMMYYDYRHRRYYIPFSREKPIIIHSRDQMEELSHAPELSIGAVYADIFGFKYTLREEETNTNTVDSAAARLRLFQRTLKMIGQSELHLLQPYLHSKISEVVKREIAKGDIRDDGWTSIKTTLAMRDIVSEPLAVYVFGRTLTENPKFRTALWKYYQDTINYQGALLFAPKLLAGYLFSKITKDGQALRDVVAILKPILANTDSDWEENEDLKKITLMHHMIHCSKESSYWTPNMLVQALIGLWFAAAHQPWINLDFAFLELSSRPATVALLRDEIASTPTLDLKSIMNELPLLDSFLKESIRLNPLDDLAIRRKSLSPYTFQQHPSSPIHIPPHRIVSISSYTQMHHPDFYPFADAFDALRYTKPTISGEKNAMCGTKLTEAAREFPIWGFGAHVCPGRWHTSLVMKMVLIHLLTNYDFTLQDEARPWKWWWDNLAMPYEGTRVLVRPSRGDGNGNGNGKI